MTRNHAMNHLKGYHQDLELNTIINWQPVKVVKYRINMIEFHCVRYKSGCHILYAL